MAYYSKKDSEIQQFNMDVKKLKEDMTSGNFERIYLLTGTEDYLRKQFKDSMRKALTNGDDDMNYSYFEGKDISIGQVIDLAETMPFLSDRRVIFIENSGWFKGGADAMADYVKNSCDTTVIVFVDANVDKKSKLYKAVSEHGYVAIFVEQTDETLTKWVAGRIAKDKKQIRREDVLYFIEKTGPEMDNMATELEKLLCFCMDRDAIYREDIDEICTTRLQSHVFNMIDAISENKQRVALDLYYELLALKEQPMVILYLIAKQCNSMLAVKQLRNSGKGIAEICDALKQKDFVVKKQANQVSRYTEAELRNAVEKCVQTEQDVKTGLLTDRLAVEMIILTVLKPSK